MLKTYEPPFYWNGMKSWFHCEDFNLTESYKINQVAYHYHDYIEILYSFSNDDFVHIGDQCYPFVAGNLVIINSEEPHKVTHTGNSRYAVIKFSPRILNSDIYNLFPTQYTVPFLTHHIKRNFLTKAETEHTEIPSICRDILREWNQKEDGHDLMIYGNILKLVAEIYRCWERSGVVGSGKTLSGDMKKALKYIDEHYPTATEKAVSDFCNISYTHFSRIFKKEIEMKFSDYLTFVRLRAAEKLLITTNVSVTEIALTVGFSSASHFVARFKAHKQITPSQFRRKFN